MDFGLSEEQTRRKHEIQTFAQEVLSPGAREREAGGRFARDLWDRAAARGLAGLSIPTAWQGQGLSTLDTALSVEAFGHGCEDAGLVFALCAHQFACAVPLWLAGSPEQQGCWLAELATGRCVGSNAITESDAGSDVSAIATTAVRSGACYRLNGIKRHVTNAPVADLFLIYARTAPGPFGLSTFLVPRHALGLEVESGPAKTGLVTAPWGTVELRDCVVPEADRLGDEGAGMAVFQESMTWERICLFAAALGAMERTLEHCLDQARRRRQFGQPIGRFQAVAHRLVDMKLRLETSRLLLYRAAWMHQSGLPCAEAVSLSKLWVSECAVHSGLDAVQLFGAAGVVPANGVDALLRDALPLRILSGTSEIQREIIAHHLGLR